MKRFNRLKYKAIVYFWSITFSSCSMRSFSDISLYRFLFCVFSSPLQTNSSMNQSIYFRFIQLIHTPFCNQHTIFCPILYYCLQRGSFSIFLFYGFDFYHRNFFSVYYSTTNHIDFLFLFGDYPNTMLITNDATLTTAAANEIIIDW